MGAVRASFGVATCLGAVALGVLSIGVWQSTHRVIPVRSSDPIQTNAPATIAQGQGEVEEAVARAALATARARYGEHSLEAADAADALVRAFQLNGKSA